MIYRCTCCGKEVAIGEICEHPPKCPTCKTIFEMKNQKLYCSKCDKEDQNAENQS